MTVFIKWSFVQRGTFPILEARGECHINTPIYEMLMVHQAASYIQDASQYYGKPYPRVPEFTGCQKLTVGFSVIFPDVSHLREFMSKIHQETS